MKITDLHDLFEAFGRTLREPSNSDDTRIADTHTIFEAYETICNKLTKTFDASLEEAIENLLDDTGHSDGHVIAGRIAIALLLRKDITLRARYRDRLANALKKSCFVPDEVMGPP